MPVTHGAGIIRFSLEDLACFSAASGDRNPLHMSADYTRKTPYGEQLVFGVLGGLACLGRLRDRPGMFLASIVLEFAGAMFVGVDYTGEVDDTSAEQATVRIYDGQRSVLKVVAAFREGAGPPIDSRAADTCVPRTEPIDHTAETLTPGCAIDGRYAPAWQHVVALAARFGLKSKGVGPAQLAALLWCSYVVGMELPGRQALFARLALDYQMVGSQAPLDYHASLRAFDQRFQLLRIDVRLAQAGDTLARGELRTFLRHNIPAAGDANTFERSDRLGGQVALVVGASRGLGARLAQALARQGCLVLANFLHGAADAELLARSLPDAPGMIVPLQGDSGDLDWCLAAKQRILRDYGRLDILICNACPPLVPLWIDPGALRRVHDYVARSLALVSTPLAAFADVLAQHAGKIAVLSSAAVSEPPAEWPHYIAAKCAIEGLTSTAAREYPSARFLIVRPPRLRTDLTNSPSGYQDAMPPEPVAARIAAWLGSPGAAGQVELLESFS